MIIDAHAHLDNVYGDVKYYLSMMEESGVSKTVLCSGGTIDITKMADFMRGKESLKTFIPSNEAVKDCFELYPDKFYGFFMVEPKYHTMDDIESAVNNGFVGIKLNPLVSKIDFTSDFIKGIFAFCAEKVIPIYLHLTLNPVASIEALRDCIDDIKPNIIIGHMGFASADGEALWLAKCNNNVFLETSVGSYMAIKKAVPVISAEKLIFGSEGPAHHQKIEIAKIKLLSLSKEEEDLIFYKNIERLIYGK